MNLNFYVSKKNRTYHFIGINPGPVMENDHMMETIDETRSNPSFMDLKVMTGGYAFSYADRSRLESLDVFIPDNLLNTLELCESRKELN